MRRSHTPRPLFDVGCAGRRRQSPAQQRWRSLSRPAVIAMAMLLAPLLLGASSGAAAASTGRVEGVVLSKATGRPVGGATIHLPDLGVTTTSGRDGRFAFAQTFRVDGAALRIGAEVT